MNPFKLLLSLAIVLFTAGCANFPSSLSPDQKPAPDRGVLVASVTADHHRQLNDAWFYVRRVGTQDPIRLSAFGPASYLYKSNDYPDHPSRRGQLVALPLEPGDYELFGWTLYLRVFGGNGYISPKTPLPVVPFKVAAGRVTYLGSLHVDTLLGRNLIGLEIAAGGDAQVVDNFDADTRLLKTKYPNLAALPIDRQAPSIPSWKAER